MGGTAPCPAQDGFFGSRPSALARESPKHTAFGFVALDPAPREPRWRLRFRARAGVGVAARTGWVVAFKGRADSLTQAEFPAPDGRISYQGLGGSLDSLG